MFVAKKKASSKNSNVKKVVKKAEIKSKKTPKKAGKKALKSALKKTVSVKKAASKKTVLKKAAVKEAVSKKSAPKKTAAKNASVKKQAIKAAKTSTKASKARAKKTTTSTSHLTKSAPVMKKLDLSGFVTPLDDRLLVKTSSAERMTPGGLYIPDTVADTSGNLEGFVVAVGRGHMNKKGHVRPMDVKVGDRVVFAQYTGSKIKIQNEDLVILREADVMGVVAK